MTPPRLLPPGHFIGDGHNHGAEPDHDHVSEHHHHEGAEHAEHAGTGNPNRSEQFRQPPSKRLNCNRAVRPKRRVPQKTV